MKDKKYNKYSNIKKYKNIYLHRFLDKCIKEYSCPLFFSFYAEKYVNAWW